MRNPRQYIDIPMPSDPNVPLTHTQLASLFPNRRAGEAFCKLVARLAAAPRPATQHAQQHTPAAVGVLEKAHTNVR